MDWHGIEQERKIKERNGTVEENIYKKNVKRKGKRRENRSREETRAEVRKTTW